MLRAVWWLPSSMGRLGCRGAPNPALVARAHYTRAWGHVGGGCTGVVGSVATGAKCIEVRVGGVHTCKWLTLEAVWLRRGVERS